MQLYIYLWIFLKSIRTAKSICILTKHKINKIAHPPDSDKYVHNLGTSVAPQPVLVVPLGETFGQGPCTLLAFMWPCPALPAAKGKLKN